MIAIAVAFLVGLAAGWLAKITFLRKVVLATASGSLIASVKWVLLQFQSDLFVPSLSYLPIWMAEASLFALLGMASGLIVCALRFRSDEEGK